jgi:hypothetical protein
LALEITRTPPLARYAQQPFLVPASDSDADIARRPRRSTTRSERAAWAPTTARSSTPSCACAAWRRCGSIAERAAGLIRGRIGAAAESETPAAA